MQLSKSSFQYIQQRAMVYMQERAYTPLCLADSWLSGFSNSLLTSQAFPIKESPKARPRALSCVLGADSITVQSTWCVPRARCRSFALLQACPVLFWHQSLECLVLTVDIPGLAQGTGPTYYHFFLLHIMSREAKYNWEASGW